LALVGQLSNPKPEELDLLMNWAGAIGMYALFALYSCPEMDKRNLKNREGY